MAYLGGTLGSIVAGAGNAIIAGKELQEQDENIQLKKQQIAMGALALQSAQKQQQTQQVVGQFLASEAAKDQSNVTDPAKSAQMYEKGAAMALQNGDFTSANEMGELAKGKLAEARQQMAVQQQEQQQKKESLASAADDYAANPTPEGYKDLARKAIDAGANPTQIPIPGTPQFASWLNQQQLASKTAAQRADFVQKAYEMDANRREKQQEHQDNVALRQASMQQTAMMREAMLADKQQMRQMERERLDLEERKFAAGGTKETSQQRQSNNAIIASGSEAVRGLHVIGALDSDQTAGPFQGLAHGTILESLAKTGSNILTTEDQQIYHTATAGLGLELARTMTLGGGRGANQATIDELQDVVTAHPGDTKATAIFKFSNAADIIRNRLESMPTPGDAEQAGKREALLKDLAKVPTPQQVLATVKDPKQRQKMLASQESMSAAMDKIDTGTPGLPGSGTGNAPVNAPPLPSGWSVQVH